jgi:hypothetical protein
MDPGTDLTIENPSIFVRLGRIIVKKIKELQEALTVNTELGAAAVEGTEFVLEVNRQQQVQITVLEGRVKLYPRHPTPEAGRRRPVSYGAGERALLDSTRAVRMAPLTRETTDSLRRRFSHLTGRVRISEDSATIRRRAVSRGADRLVPCSIPNLSGLTEQQATDSLRSAGMQVGQISRGSGDTVVDQDPTPGSARCGTVVSFTLGTAPDIIR